jgi:hypothetical protein
MTHMASAYLVKRAVSPGKNMLAFLAGATLPDLVSYLPLFVVGAGASLQRAGLLDLHRLPSWFEDLPYLFAPFHGIVPFFLLCWILALGFPAERRKGIFVNLASGAALHFLMDLLQVSHNPVGYLFFPFSRDSVSLGWIGTESSLAAAPLLAGVAAVVLLWDHVRKRKDGPSREEP